MHDRQNYSVPVIVEPWQVVQRACMSTAGFIPVTRAGQDSVTVVTALCTHETCTITELSGTTYVCPCHGSRFNNSGRVLAGPATVSLQTFATSFSGGTSSITV
ncbi:Rieske 2Fe-2S domain-containing protein [bacterium AH-315-O15]|nr:Rieske 2Fe-2S domain-containing protein [bacterium AH-315-O15]